MLYLNYNLIQMFFRTICVHVRYINQIWNSWNNLYSIVYLFFFLNLI